MAESKDNKEPKENKGLDEKFNRVLDLIKSGWIKLLNLDDEFGDHLTAEQLSKLSEALKENSSVTKIIFSKIKINVNDLLNFLKSLKDKESIKSLGILEVTDSNGQDLFEDPNFLNGLHEVFATQTDLREFSFLAGKAGNEAMSEFVKKCSQNIPSRFFRLHHPGEFDENVRRPVVVTIQEGFDSILKQIRDKDPRAQVVDLSNRTLNASQIQELSVALSENNQVLSLNLEGATVELDAFPSLLMVLSNHPSVQELNLNYLRFQSETSESKSSLDSRAGGQKTEVKASKEEILQKAFQEMIRKNEVLRKLRIIDIDDKFWVGKGFELFMDALIENQPVQKGTKKPPKKGSQIFHLELDNREDKELKKLAKFLELTQTLEILIIEKRYPRHFDSEMITKALSQNTQSRLRVLKMNDHTLNEVAIGHIAALLNKQRLRKLSLHNCEIHSESAKILADALGKNESVEELDLSHNRITSERYRASKKHGFKAICVALANNPHSKLETLNLAYIGLGSEGVYTDIAPIVILLKNNKVLRNLMLNGNNLRDQEFKLLAEGLSQNEGLVSLNLDGHACSTVGLLALEQALDTNTTLTDLQFKPSGDFMNAQPNQLRLEDYEFRGAAVRIGGKLAENQYQMRLGAYRSSTNSDEQQAMTMGFDKTKNKPTLPVSGEPIPPKPESKKPE